MNVPPVILLSIVSPAAPLLAAAVGRQPLRGARAWTALWCGLLLITMCLSLYVGQILHRNNLWLEEVYTPVSTVLVLWALSSWQPAELARLTMRLAIVPVLILWAVLTAAFDTASTFSRAAVPMVNLVCFGAAAFTLLARSLRASGDLVRQDWLWVAAGMALHFGSWSLLVPLSGLVAGTAAGLLQRAYELQAVLSTVAMLAVAKGMTCRATS